MKKIIFAILAISATTLMTVSSCKKDEGKSPNISFKTSSGYTSTDANKAPGAAILLGINASKAEDKDVLKHLNVSKSVNGAAGVNLFDTDLSGTDGDSYSKDINDIAGSTVGEKDKYTCTITNRDGLTNSVSLTVTVQ